MLRQIFILLFIATASAGASAQPLTLQECYTLAEANYPLTHQRGLIAKTESYTIDNLSKGIYPQLAVSGSATYQSDVTSVSIPGYNIPTVSKDQYQVHGEVSQTLTDFGITQRKKQISRTDAAVQEENLNAQLYALKDRVNQLFFGILLIDGQLEQNDLSVANIQTGIDKVQAAIANGTDFHSSLAKLQAELLTTDQHAIELRASRRAYTDMLGLFLDRTLDDSAQLVKPGTPDMNDSINRPEVRSYDLQIQSYKDQLQLTRANLFPSLSAFFQGGYGKPNPVNVLAPNWSLYYITGLRLSWNIGGLYTYRKDRLTSHNNEAMVEADRNTFLFNTQMTLHQQNADVRRYEALVNSDDEIIRLRQSVTKTSAAQLANGVLSANDYLLDVNAEAQARQDRVVHQIQMLISEYDHKTTSGN
ncbi:TolC family protein [Dinghuibacter silviterrae]|uniref:Outer membrane protein TolC n=1 Tax=Dinghuibacter silviterrae TaxID=1539049 RepID=A0A4R8DEX9_9BACT|nr:TolC family protein [Dinghuibacter silviterrae]TDW96133.1 outer membrane protein TolC [Dinghuibacter silviterrae]